MTHHPESRTPFITVMTCRDAEKIFTVLKAASAGNRRQMPPGVAEVEDLYAIIRGGVAFFVAYDADEAIGVIGYRWERGTLKIFHVAVVGTHQRLGVCRRLVQAVEAIGFALGTTSVTIEVREEWAQHVPFERFGYARGDAPVPDAGRLTMTKALSGRSG